MKKPKKFKSTSAEKTLQKGKEVVISTKEAKKDFSQFGFRFKNSFRMVGRLFYKFKINLLIKLLIILTVPVLIFVTFYLFEQVSTLRVTNIAASYKAREYPLFGGHTELETTASSYILYEKDSRVIVASKNENFRFAPASTAKMMTALVAVESYSLDIYLPARSMGLVLGSKMGLFDGEEMRVQDLLYGLMLPSGNDAAEVLAQNYPGGKDAFVARMNEYATDLKLYNTEFFDPSGLDDRNYSTALDLVRLATRLLENYTLREVVKTQTKTVTDRTGKISHKLVNLNELLTDSQVTGVKTGYTEEAGGVLVTSFVSHNKTYIIVVLRSDDRFGDTEQIIRNVINEINLLRY